MKSQRSKSFPTTRNPFLNDTLIAVVGSIYWLDQKNNHDVELLRSYDLDDGFYDHPVVVISTDPGREEALVFVVGKHYNKIRLIDSDFPSLSLLKTKIFKIFRTASTFVVVSYQSPRPPIQIMVFSSSYILELNFQRPLM